MPSDNNEYNEISISELKENQEEIKKHEIPVVRKNRDGEFVYVPMSNIEAIIGASGLSGGKSNIQLYIKNGWKDIINRGAKDYSFNKKERVFDDNAYSKKMSKTIDNYRSMSMKDKGSHLNSLGSALQSYKNKKQPLSEEETQEISKASTDAGVMNGLALGDTAKEVESEKISAEEAMKKTQDIASNTNQIVNSIIDIVMEQPQIQEALGKMENYSTGTTIGHSNRVFMVFIKYLVHYNNFLSKGGASKIRSSFKSVYNRIYSKLLPGKTLSTVENVIEKGVSRIEPDMIQTYSLGALLHDVGKITDLNYFEGSEEADMRKISRHVFDSYKMLMRTMAYPWEVATMAAYHHEYYGHADGYGVFRNLQKLKEKNLGHPIDFSYIISYERSSVENFYSFSYFPAKLLEIVDVYDALTDSTRPSRGLKVMSAEEAIELMRNIFIVKNLKLDPILFDIFVDFIGSENGKDLSKFRIDKLIQK